MAEQKSVPTHLPFIHQQTGEDIFILEATAQLQCHQCSRVIEAGELFSRSADKKGLVYGIRYTNCRNCVPFEPVLQPV
jgi:hypothetical protein